MKYELLKLQEEKNKISPFRIGDKVVCCWGSSGYNQEGIIIDNLVNYNGHKEFSKENCEPACIVRLKIKKLPAGFEVNNNEVIPFDQIKKIITKSNKRS